MGIIGGTLGYNLLRRISVDGETGYCDGSAYQGISKIEKLLGKNIWRDTKDKVVIDSDYVKKMVADIAKDQDLSRYIL